MFHELYPGFEAPDIVTKFWGKLLALGLVLAGTYAYLYLRPGGPPGGRVSADRRLHAALGRGAADYPRGRMADPDRRGGDRRPGAERRWW